MPTNAPARGRRVGLTGTVTYVNVAAGKDVYGVFYRSSLHAGALQRRSAAPRDFDRKFNIHIEAYVGGAKMDYYRQEPRTRTGLDWYKSIRRRFPDLVYRQDQTPFIVGRSDRYPAIKLPPRRSSSSAHVLATHLRF